ncbi:hypothetical protein [Streptomyces sp. NPDC007020]|uniref:hypothetical protein n=1 Tax=Streptomyces sp. NPDC007020 TaxID=3154585 RepID=UPI0033DFC7C0
MTDTAPEAGQPDHDVPEGAPRASKRCAVQSVNSDAGAADVATRARKQFEAQLNSPFLEAAARMQETMNSPLLEAAARMQETMNSPLLEAAARVQKEFSSPLLEAVLPTLQAVAVHASIRQSALDNLQEAANQSALRQMQAVTPLLGDILGRSMLDVVDNTLESLEDLEEEVYEEVSAGDLSDEMVREIEEALSGFEPATQGLPPAVARQVWIVWVQTVVFTLSLYALITVPGAMTLGGLLGVGALAGVRKAGILAAKVWDKHYS